MKPYAAVEVQTLARWKSATLKKRGVSTDIFTPHSTRHASTSAAFKRGVSIDIINHADSLDQFLPVSNHRPIVNLEDFAN